MTKQILEKSSRKKFDLKFLLVSNPGVGKTHLCGTYTKGPVHFYMFDYGGEKTLDKLNASRPKESPITIDYINPRTDSYQKFWSLIQKDERSGFYQDMADKNGLVVLPDSITSVNDMMMNAIAKANGRDLQSSDKPMRIQDWGQQIQWLKALVAVVNSLPCAAVTTAHLKTDTASDGSVLQRHPSITGQYASQMGRDFDEVYYLTERAKKRWLYMTNYDQFQAKTRVFSNDKLENPTMDQIAEAYMTGKVEI